MKRLCLALLFCSALDTLGQPLQLKKTQTNSTASFRGLSVVNNTTAWVSGTKGSVGVTSDGGKTWSFQPVTGYETLDFRSVYALDARHAIIANVGSPANILMTRDGGKNWKSVYTNNHSDAFIDGIDFWDAQNGMIYGDPIDGKMFLLRTTDGGQSWTPVKEPPALEEGEASFAASGTGIRCINKQQVMICTGGTVSRLWVSDDRGEHWKSYKAPILQGASTKGIFSFAQHNSILHIVGGDYKNMTLNKDHHFYSTDGGSQWTAPTTPIRGYRECIEAVNEKILVSTGPTGTDISYDDGKNWASLSDDPGMHVVRKSRRGSFVLLAGSDGQIFVLEGLQTASTK